MYSKLGLIYIPVINKQIMIYTYSMFFTLAFLIPLIVAIIKGRKDGIKWYEFLILVYIIYNASVIGARIFYLLEVGEVHFWNQLFKKILYGGPGAVFYGGLIFGFLFSYLYLKIRKLSIGKFADIIGCVLPLGTSIGRIGCFFAGCCYGKTTDSLIGVKFPRLSGYRYPTQLFYVFGSLLIFLFLNYFYKRKYQGEIFILFLILFSLLNFIVEFFRVNEIVLLNLTLNQLISIIVFFIAGMIFIRKKRLYENIS